MGEFVRTYGKTLAALLVELALIVQAAVTDDVITTNEWQKIGIGALSVVLVFFAPARTNQPSLRAPRTRDDLKGNL
jgi:hypothetical protein